MDITLLGTGSPLPDPRRGGPATLVRTSGHQILVDAGRAHQEPPEPGAHHVDRGVHLAGGGAGLGLRCALIGLVGLKHPEIAHCPCLLPVDDGVSSL